MPNEDFPRDWDIEAEKHKWYEQLTDGSKKISPFHGKNFADVFIYAMVIGFHKKLRLPIKKRMSSVPFSVLKDMEWVIRAIAVSETGDLKILFNKRDIANIAEEYANGGIEYLYKLIFTEEPGEAYKRMEDELKTLLASQKDSESPISATSLAPDTQDRK
ncbi:MAG: hypothetical protein JRN19_06445 [Nitrososphaerota archaeon]|nr:hypothetical protein [Nitrososphaerota archaeon]MDG7052071.1 hypothetical protein [Nitrososphaerota archaeon]